MYYNNERKQTIVIKFKFCKLNKFSKLFASAQSSITKTLSSIKPIKMYSSYSLEKGCSNKATKNRVRINIGTVCVLIGREATEISSWVLSRVWKFVS